MSGIDRIVRGLFSILLLALVAGCGPQYETRYVYTAPADSLESRQCLQNCEFQRQQCMVLADNNQQLCEMQARNEEYQCQAEARYYYARCVDRNPDNPERCRYPHVFCPQRSCWRNDGRCEDLYRSCYTACGGSIQSETVCTANCDDVPPPAMPLP